MTCIGGRPGVLALLYVDDEPALLEIGKLFLERTGDFSVTTAPGAETAIEHLKHHHFDAIVSDYQMPGMTGIGLLKHLRSAGDTTPFIIFTGKGREEVVIQALNEGADFYIQKGGDPKAQFADLMNKIRYAVRRRHAEQEVLQAGDRYKALIAVSNTGAWEYDLDSGFLWCSPEYFTMIGQNADNFDLSGNPNLQEVWIDLIHPDDRDHAARAFEEYLESQNPGMYENHFRMRHVRGHWIWIWSRGWRLRDRDRNLARKTIGTHIDITLRKEAELRRDEINERLVASCEELALADEVLQQQLDEITITQEELDRSRKQYKAIFECTQAATIIINPDTTIALANSAFEDITGWQKDEVVGKSWTEFVCESELEKIVGYHQQRRSGDQGGDAPKSYEFHLIDRTGTPHPVIITVGIIMGTGQSVASVYDITRQKSQEKALKQAEAEKRAIFDSMPLMLAYYDTDLRIRYVNRISGESAGQDPATLIGRHCYEIWHGRPDPCEECPVIKSMKTGKIEEGEKRLPDGRVYHIRGSPIYDDAGDLIGCIEFGIDITRRKKAEEALRAASLYTRTLIETSLDPLVTISPEGLITDVNRATEEATGRSRNELIGTVFAEYFTDPNQAEEGYKKAFRSGSVKDYPLTIHHLSGRTTDVLYNASVYRGPDGNIHGLFAAARDITTRKRAEEAILTAQRKLRILSGVTRHDIQNRIMVLQGYLDLIREGCDPQIQSHYLHEINTASDAIQRYIEFTRQYEDLGIEMPVWRSLPDIIKGVENSRISVHYESQEYVILGDPMLERVFYNLMDNTIRHAEGAASVTISCEERNGDLAILWKDDGAGIQGDQKKQIFERGVGKNTGFGLFLCREILAITGITIQETGMYGEGAQFEMIVPEGTWKNIDIIV